MALMDKTGYVNIPKHAAVLVVHLFFTLYVGWTVHRDIAASVQRPVPSSSPNKETPQNTVEPHLADERMEKKKPSIK